MAGCLLLVVCIAVEESTPDSDVVTVTYNGSALTQAVEHRTPTSTEMNCEIWYMLEADLPAAGTYTVFIDCPNLGERKMVLGTTPITSATSVIVILLLLFVFFSIPNTSYI